MADDRNPSTRIPMKHYGPWWIRKELGSGGQATVYLGTRISRDEFKTFDGDWKSSTALGGTTHANQASTLEMLWRAFEVFQSAQHGAIKVLHPENLAKNRENYKARFQREIEALRAVKHPNLVEVIDANLDDGWFVMTFCPGGPLSHRLNSFAGNAGRALLAIRPVAEAVAKLHEHGYIHRDINPKNVLFNDRDQLVLGDCGLAFSTDDDPRLTLSRETVGTKNYMPSLAQGPGQGEVLPWFDTYSLGKLFWSLVTGQWTFGGEAVTYKTHSLETRFDGQTWSRRVTEFLQKCITPIPEDGLRDGAQFLVELDRLGAELGMLPSANESAPPTASPNSLQRILPFIDEDLLEPAADLLLAAADSDGFVRVARTPEGIQVGVLSKMTVGPKGRERVAAYVCAIEDMTSQALLSERSENSWELAHRGYVAVRAIRAMRTATA